MGLKRTDEFRQDAVRIALTSGLTRSLRVAKRALGAARKRDKFQIIVSGLETNCFLVLIVAEM